MKTITLQVDEKIASQILKNLEEGLSIKRDERNELNEQISVLEQQFRKSLREQNSGSDGEIPRLPPSGENKSKITACYRLIYLKTKAQRSVRNC